MLCLLFVLFMFLLSGRVKLERFPPYTKTLRYDTELQKVRKDLSAKELELETQRSLVGNNDNRVTQLRTELSELK